MSLCANELGLSIRNSRDFVKMTVTRVDTEVCATRLCSHTFSVGLNPET